MTLYFYNFITFPISPMWEARILRQECVLSQFVLTSATQSFSPPSYLHQITGTWTAGHIQSNWNVWLKKKKTFCKQSLTCPKGTYASVSLQWGWTESYKKWTDGGGGVNRVISAHCPHIHVDLQTSWHGKTSINLSWFVLPGSMFSESIKVQEVIQIQDQRPAPLHFPKLSWAPEIYFKPCQICIHKLTLLISSDHTLLLG